MSNHVHCVQVCCVDASVLGPHSRERNEQAGCRAERKSRLGCDGGDHGDVDSGLQIDSFVGETRQRVQFRSPPFWALSESFNLSNCFYRVSPSSLSPYIVFVESFILRDAGERSHATSPRHNRQFAQTILPFKIPSRRKVRVMYRVLNFCGQFRLSASERE